MIELRKWQIISRLALFLPGILAVCLYFSEGTYCYRLWYVSRLIIILFCFPVWVEKEDSQTKLAQLYHLILIVGIPISIAATIIEGLSFTVTLCYEIFLLFLSLELVWLNPAAILQGYQPTAFIITTAPPFLYFLYLDTWHIPLANLLKLSPLGSIWSLTTDFPYFIFFPLSYIIIYKLARKIYLYLIC